MDIREIENVIDNLHKEHPALSRTKEQVTYELYMKNRPYVVILGAGASCVAIPDGDKYGKRISAMSGFIDKLSLSNIWVFLTYLSHRTGSSEPSFCRKMSQHSGRESHALNIQIPPAFIPWSH